MDEYGEGIPRGNKSAGYVGLMLAKEMGKTRSDYNPVQRKKKIGKFDINKMKDPSDFIKSAYIDKYKGLHTGHPARTWEQVKAAASDLKHAVATWARLHPNKDERTIARETGVSQPSVNRWKRLTGGAKNPLTKEEEQMWQDFVLEEEDRKDTEYSASKVRRYARNKYEFGLFLVKGIRKVAIITKLVKMMKKWYELVRDLYNHVYYSADDVEHRKMMLENSAEEISPMSGVVLPEELTAEEGDPTALSKRRAWGFSDKDTLLAKKQYYLRSNKQEMFKAAIVVKQIVLAINKAIEQLKIQDPTKEIKLQEENVDPDAAAYMPSNMKEFDRNEELVLAEDAPENPDGSGKARGGSGPNYINQFAAKYEARPVRGGNGPNYINQFAAKYEARPVRGGAMAKQLYTADGKLYNGLWHQMSDGAYHSGKKHGKRSKPLFLK